MDERHFNKVERESYLHFFDERDRILRVFKIFEKDVVFISRYIRFLTFPCFLLFSLITLQIAATPAWSMSAMEFYQLALKHQDINAFAATCQSAHETGWWTSKLWRTANNGAGIKAGKDWRGQGKPAVNHLSPEVVGNQLVYRTSYFRSYSDAEDFMRDYRNKIVRDYPHSARNSDTVWGYFAGLQKGRYGSWATSQNYYRQMVGKAFKLAPSLLGLEWRAKLLADYHEAKKRNALKPWQADIIRKNLMASGLGAEINYP